MLSRELLRVKRVSKKKDNRAEDVCEKTGRWAGAVEGRTVNKKFRNAAVGRGGGLIGSLVCLCQAAMPTLRASFTPTPGRANRRRNEGRKEERTDGPTAGQGRGGGMDRRRSFGGKQGGKTDGRTEIYRMDIMCVCARVCVLKGGSGSFAM